MSNVKATKKSKNAIKSKKTKIIGNDIPVDQKHQIISVKEFGDYNYDTRREQWHQKAGHNDHQEVCAICHDDDNWATVEVDNGAHICYFCWVKKPTEETKKIVATAKKITPNKINKNLNNYSMVRANNRNMHTNNNNDYNNYPTDVEIVKFYDDKGVSYRNADEIQNYRTDKNTIDKTSRYGVSPAVFYDPTVDYKQPHNKIYVVRPYDNYLVNSAKTIRVFADNKSKQAINEYNEEVMRAKLLTKRNIVAAKIDSLRLLTKAIVMEKNAYEQENEKSRHQQAMENIKVLREERLEKNKLNLADSINRINMQHDNALKRNEDDLIKARVRLEQQIMINDLKVQRQKEKVRILSRGEDYHPVSIRQEIRAIKQNKYIPNQFNLSSDDHTVAELVLRLKDMDPAKLSESEREAVIKFLRLVDSYDKQEKYEQLSKEYKEAINTIDKKIAKSMRKNPKRNDNKNEYMIVSYDTYKKIVNAKKETLVISMPVKQLQQQAIQVKYKTVKVKKPSSTLKQPVTSKNALVKIKPEHMQFEKMDYQKVDLLDSYYARDIQRTIDKFKRIVRNTYKASDYTVSPFGANAYKINYIRMPYTKYQLKYKKSWRDWFGLSNKNADARFNQDQVSYMSLEEFNREGEHWYSNLFKPKLNDYGQPIAKHLNKLRRLVETLPSDPVIMQNNGLFQQERVDLSNAIKQLRALDINHNWTQQQVDETLAEVNRILDLYHEIASADTKYRNNVRKAQIEDEKLLRNIDYYERMIVNGYANADYAYNEKSSRIKEMYLRNLENAENQSLLNVEYIYEQEQTGLDKEQQQHLSNCASLFQGNNKLANNQYKYQNTLINAMASEINHYNKHTNNPLSLIELPAKINKLPINSNESIYLSCDKLGKNVIVKAESNQRRSSTIAKAVNKTIPTDVQAIYILDKYRNVQDLKTRVALLTESAKTSYEAAVKYNQQREQKEIANAYENLEKKLQEVNAIYEDVQEINFAGQRLNHLVDERNWVQNNYNYLKDEKWKIYDKDQYYKQKIEALREKQERKELMLIQKQQNKYERQKNRIVRKQKSKELDYHDVIRQK